MILPHLTGYIVHLFGQYRYFKSFSDAKAYVDHVTGGKAK
jgi:hypothetical protein